jgi:hypothetical protein
MNLSITTKNRLILATAIILLLSCVKNQDSSSDQNPDLTNGNGNLEPINVFGTFRTASCILNKTETISQGKNIYSLVTFAMKEDGNGVYHDELYVQEGCNGMPTWQDRAIIFVEKTDVNGISLFEIERTNLDGSTEHYFVPFYRSRTNYYFHLDYSSGNSGPYSQLPSEEELREFKEAPTTVGTKMLSI